MNLTRLTFMLFLLHKPEGLIRKDKEMLVTVKLNDSSTITPVYEPGPGRAEALIKFYSEQFHTFQIQGYKIENQAGKVWAEGTL